MVDKRKGDPAKAVGDKTNKRLRAEVEELKAKMGEMEQELQVVHS